MLSLPNLDKLLQQAQSIRSLVESVETRVVPKEKTEEQEIRLVLTARLCYLRSVRQAVWSGLLVLEPNLVEQIDKALTPQVAGELVVPEAFDITALQHIVDSQDFRDFERVNEVKT